MRRVQNRIATGVLLFSILFPQLHAETLDQHDQRMQWWREARFGMFIHWGLYAVPAGEYGGKSVDEIGEWIMHFARIPRAEYEQFAAQFNPQNFNADEWVRMAKYAGMKYIVVTTKHHDGFCLFDASNSTYDIVDSTPYGKDVLREISEACRRHGIIFCTYYSIMDWHHPSQLPASEENGRPVWSPSRMMEEKKSEYVQYMKEHLRQLIMEYHTHLLWFDGEWPDWWTDSDARELYQWLRSLNPDLIVNNRIGKGRKGYAGFTENGFFAGDFGTPEQEIPATGVNIDWESCMTMNHTWGYKSSDHNWKTAETLIRNLIDVVSKGGNYLLNIGPDAQGTVPEESVQRLRDIGQWMSVNGESIYGTQAALFRPDWGRVTRRAGTLYLHVFDWPTDGKLVIPALQNRFIRASLLARPEVSLAVETGSENWGITLPFPAIDSIATVVALDVDGVPELKDECRDSL
ncbi:MAG: alpha-L-fucosidase [Kiritimatiellales bacterium]